MRPGLWAVCAVVGVSCQQVAAQVVPPFQLADDVESVYAPPAPPSADEGVNAGGVNFSLDISYLSHYVYRGIDQTTPPFTDSEHAFQFDSELHFNLGKLPHPFIGIFANVFNEDPVTRFEEVRPYAGLDWNLRPLLVSAGLNSYIFPSREKMDTQEVWARLAIDDSLFFHADRPVFKPYFYGAYDFDKYDGLYFEGGLQHDFVFQDIGLTLTTVGDVAYVAHNRYFAKSGPNSAETGFQHYDVGLIADYSLNYVLHIPRRYGTWDLKGYLYYTGPISDQLRGDSRLWGGVGISFNY